MKLSHSRGMQRAALICRLAEPLAAIHSAAAQPPPRSATQWTALVAAGQTEALKALSILSGRSLEKLRGMQRKRLLHLAWQTLDTELLQLLGLLEHVAPQAVQAAVYQFGPPPDIHALTALLSQHQEALSWRHYIAEMNRLTTQSLYGLSSLPRYAHLTRPFSSPAANTLQSLTAALKQKGATQHEALPHHPLPPA